MLVSILIPCFNAEKWIGQAVDSALSQTWSDKEIIVVDDGSTDGSVDVIRRFEGRLRWETGPNRGGNAARNRLLELAKGEWLQYLDADDYLLPEKVERQVEFVGRHPEADVVYSPTLCEKIIDGRTVLVNEPLADTRDPWVLLALWQLPQTGGPLWKRDALERVGGWRLGQICCQEHELYFRLLAAGCSFAFFGDRSAVYRNWDIGGRLTTKLINDVPRQKLMIFDRIEGYLGGAGLLTVARRQAINDGRHQIARRVWHYDRGLAMDVARRIARSDAGYCPTQGHVSSTAYRVVYRLVGFARAEHLGAVGRRILGRAVLE